MRHDKVGPIIIYTIVFIIVAKYMKTQTDFLPLVLFVSILWPYIFALTVVALPFIGLWKFIVWL
jgi:hypothetical protein